MIKQILSFGIVESVSKGLNFLILLLLPLFIPVKEFGIVGIIVSIEALFSTMLLFGQDRVILRYYSFEKNKKAFLSSVILVWAVVASLIVFFSLIVVHFIFKDGIYGIKLWPGLVLLSVIILLTSFRFLYIAITRTQTNVKLFSIDKLVFQILKISLVIFFALSLKSSSSYIYGLFIALIIVFILEMYFLKDKFLAKLDCEKIKRNWKFGYPFVLHVMAGNILIYFSRFVLEKYASLETVALYTFASNLGLSISFVYAAFIVYFEPQIYKHSNNVKKSESLLGLFSLSILAINAIVIIIILLLVPIVIKTYFNAEYLKIIPILPIILAAISLNIIYLQSSYRLTIYEKTKLIPLATIIAGVFNILLNLILVPKFGLIGAAVTTFFSYLVLSMITFIFSIKFTQVLLKDILIKKNLLLVIIVGVIALYTKYFTLYIGSLIIFIVITVFSLFKNIVLLRQKIL